MSIKITIIPEGKFELRQLVRGRETTSYDVFKNGNKLAKIDLTVSWSKENYPSADIWELTNKLRQSNVIGKESTIVASLTDGISFPDGIAMKIKFGSKAEVVHSLDDLD